MSFLDLGFSYLKLRDRVRHHEREYRCRRRSSSECCDFESIKVSTQNVFHDASESNNEGSYDKNQDVEVSLMYFGFIFFFQEIH